MPPDPNKKRGGGTAAASPREKAAKVDLADPSDTTAAHLNSLLASGNASQDSLTDSQLLLYTDTIDKNVALAGGIGSGLPAASGTAGPSGSSKVLTRQPSASGGKGGAD